LLAIKKDFTRLPVIFRAGLDISIEDFYRPLMDALMASYEALFLFQLEGPELVSAVKDILENAETMNFGYARLEEEPTVGGMKRLRSSDIQESPNQKEDDNSGPNPNRETVVVYERNTGFVMHRLG
jgi:hypothetical protein